MSTTLHQGSLTNNILYSDGKLTLGFSNGDGTFKVGYLSNLINDSDTISWAQNGKIFSGGDLGNFILDAFGQASVALTNFESQKVSGSDSSLMASPAAGVADAIANAASSRYLAARLALDAVSDRWAPAFLNGQITAGMLLSNSLSAAIWQAASVIAQAQWQARQAQPSVFTVKVLGLGGIGNPSYPLVLDLTGAGIKLVDPSQSSATFDLDANGTREAAGWVGAGNGILVFDKNGNGRVDDASEWFGQSFSASGATPPANQSGFAALATLVQAGATTFSRETAAIDPATGKSYFDLVQVWVDANQDGVTDKGELRSLAELGIASIDLTGTVDGRQVAGGEIALTAGYTKSDGTRGTIADVGLTAAGEAAPAVGQWVPSTAALLFAEYASKGYAALSKGQAQGAANALAANAVNTAGVIGALQSRMATQRYLSWQGYPNILFKVRDNSLITFYVGEDSSKQLGSRAGIDVLALLQDGGSLQSNGVATATAVARGADAIVQAYSAAQVANATGTADARNRADSLATTAAMTWGQAIAAYLTAAATSTQFTQRTETARIELNALVPVAYTYTNSLPGGYSYFSPGDASFAAEAFDGFATVLQLQSNVKIALDGVLSAIAQSAGYGTVYVGHAGETVVVGNGFNLLLAGGGSETFSLGSNVDHVALSAASSAVTVNGFQTGASGDQIQLLGIGDKVSVRAIAGGIQLLLGDGQRYVNLNGVSASNLSLFSNLVGVSEISFAEFNQSGTRSIEGQRLYDGQVHIRKIVASNYGDTLIGDSEASTLVGGRGDDTFIVNGRGYQIDGGIGEDRVSYDRLAQGVTVNLQAGNDSLGSSLFQIEQILGSGYRDYLTGDTRNNVFDGGQGYDTIAGGGGNDVYLFGRGDGVDTIINGVDGNAGASSVLRLKAGISGDQLWFSRDGNDLVVQVLGVNDRVVVSGWYALAYRKLGAIELAGGARLSVAAVESLVTSLAAYQAAHADFDPRTAQALPAGVSVASSFLSGLDVPQVSQATNVSLEVQRAYAAGRANQGAATANNVVASMNGAGSVLTSYNSNARYWRGQVSPIGIPGGYHLYSYQSNLTSDTMIAVTAKNFNDPSPFTGRGADVVSWRELGALETDRLYFNKASTGGIPPTTTTNIVEWAVGVPDAIIADVDVVTANLAAYASAAQNISSGASARQAALAAAVTANGSKTVATLQQARQSALVAEQGLSSALSAYQAVNSYLGQMSAALGRNASRLGGLVPANAYWSAPMQRPNGTWVTVNYSTEYSFYSGVDANKYASLVDAQSMAQNYVNAALANLASLNGVFATMGDWSNAQLVSPGGTTFASAAGDLLLSMGGGSHVMYGGAARDTFAFVSSTGALADAVNGFEAGALGDRLLVVPAAARTAYFSEGAGGVVRLTYDTASGAGTGVVQVNNVTYQQFSLYDNLRGIETADFRNIQHGVDITLNTVTPRDADGFTHVRNISGTAYADTIAGDAQDNIITGGAGNDILMGGIGDDTYIWRKGDGSDIIREQDQGVTSNNTDVLKLADVNAAQVSFLRRGNDLLVTIVPTGEVITIEGQYASLEQRVEVLEYADGSRRVLPTVNTLPTGSLDITLGAALLTATTALAQNDVLTAVANFADTDGIGALRVQWYADDIAIAGATAMTFAPGQAQVGKKISVKVEYTDGFGTVEKLGSVQSTTVANRNDAPTGTVLISGTVLEGQALVASHTLGDIDGLGAVHYQWFADGVAIDGAATDTIVLGAAQGNKKISVQAAYVDGFGTAEAVMSAQTVQVPHLNRPVTGVVAMLMAGQMVDAATVLKQGDSLQARASLADPDGLGVLGYQWYADGQAIVGATGDNLVLAQGQVGKKITVEARYVDGYGAAEKVASVASAVVANVNDAPVGNVTLVGRAMRGGTLSVRLDFTDADGIGSLRYRWYADGQLITGEAASSLVLSGGVAGKAISVAVEYEDGFGTTETLVSAPSAPVSPGIVGTEGNDILYGTPGQDILVGLGGNDTYYLDDPDDLIVEQTGGGQDIAYVSFNYRVPENVEIVIAQTGGVTIYGGAQTISYQARHSGGIIMIGSPAAAIATYAQSSNRAVARLYGANESYVSTPQNDVLVGMKLLIGSRFNDELVGDDNVNSITGGLGDDVLWGRGGNDNLSGNAGSDTYLFGRGDGQDTVNDLWSAVPGERNVVKFLEQVAYDQLWFSRTGADLEISIIGTTEKLRVVGWATTPGQYPIQEFRTANGYILSAERVQALLIAMSGMAPPPLGTLDLPASYRASLGAAITSGWRLNHQATGSVRIDGTPQAGRTLLAQANVQDADGIVQGQAGSLFYQWYADGDEIGGAMGQSYTLTSADAGRDITVRVKFVDGIGSGESLTSQAVKVPAFVATAAMRAASDAGNASLDGSNQQIVLPALSVVELGLDAQALSAVAGWDAGQAWNWPETVARTDTLPGELPHMTDAAQLIQAMAAFAPAGAARSKLQLHTPQAEVISLAAAH